MREQGLHIIYRIRKKWIAVSLFSNTVFATAFAIIYYFIACRIFHAPWWTVMPFFVLALAVMLYIDRMWRVTEKEVARFLNKKYPLLGESCELLLAEYSLLNMLEKIQVSRTTEALRQIEQPSLFANSRRALFTLLTAIVLCVLLSFFVHDTVNNRSENLSPGKGTEEILPAGVSKIRVVITPPSYTHKKVRQQKNMNLAIEEGASVHWELEMTKKVTGVVFRYNDSVSIPLQNVEGTNTWVSDKIITHPGFYQVNIDSIVSELYKIEVTKDLAPVIQISSPKPTMIIEYGEPQRVHLQANVSDDYGVKNVSINATVAKGSGEGVKFKSQQLSFETSFAAEQTQYSLQKMIGLAALGMEPGDELYFYITATDNHAQEKRSDIYIVTLTDTAKLMSMDGLLNGVNLKPDYFRSQRQIIIETEQLIRDKDTASIENFNNRSNNLGIDQKLLRLRYGKFLGEEASSNEDVTGDHGLGDPSQFGNAALILDAFTDKHDIAEDATFLDPETKKQLKATLTEMWGAELKLRTFKPQEALVYEYKALRLLKDLQQKSRAYVAKTSIKTAPIKLEKRLTGKLEKITEPVTRQSIAAPVDPVEELRTALAILEQLKKRVILNERGIQVLRIASAQLSSYAAKDPALFLPALENMKRIINTAQEKQMAANADIMIAQRALQKIAGTPAGLPSQKRSSAGSSLSEQYFKNLSKKSQP